MADAAPEPSNQPAVSLAIGGALGWTLALILGTAIGGEMLAELRPASAYDEGAFSLIQLAISLACVLGIALVHAPQESLRAVLGARPLTFPTALSAGLMGASAAVPLGALERFIEVHRPLPAELTETIVQGLATLPPSTRVAGAVVRIILAPIAYELFYRGALFRGLEKSRGVAGAATLTTLLFAVQSTLGAPTYAPLALVTGLMLVHARIATGSVLAPLAAHLAYYAVDAVLTWRAHGSIDPLIAGTSIDPPIAHATLAIATAAALAFAFALYHFGVTTRAPDAAPATEAT